MLVRQLLGMEPHAKAMMRGGLEHALDFVGREGDRLTEGIDAGGEALLRCSRDQLFDDLADVMGPAIALVGRSA